MSLKHKGDRNTETGIAHLASAKWASTLLEYRQLKLICMVHPEAPLAHRQRHLRQHVAVISATEGVLKPLVRIRERCRHCEFKVHKDAILVGSMFAIKQARAQGLDHACMKSKTKENKQNKNNKTCQEELLSLTREDKRRVCKV